MSTVPVVTTSLPFDTPDTDKGVSLPQLEYEAKVRGWAMEAITEGDAFLRSQPGYDKIEDAMTAIFSSPLGNLKSPRLSTTSSNRYAKIALDMASGLTDIKPFWEYRTFNKRYEQTAEKFGKLSLHLWLNRFFDLRFCDGIKYALVGATGWLHQLYDSTAQDLDLTAEDPRDVLPIRPADNYTIQTALGVCIRRARPTNYLKMRYPDKANRIKTDRDASFARIQQETRFGRLMAAIGLNQSPFHATLFGSKPISPLNIPVTDLYTLYVRDTTRNTSGQPRYVGEFDADGNALNNWSYIVAPGRPLYPRGRCIMLTRTCVLYDGPNIYWHGLFPVSKLTLDPWPWAWLGKAPLHDLLALQRTYDSQLRGFEDHFEKVWRPDIVADKNSISRAQLDKTDFRRAGAKIMQNPVAGKGMQIVYPNPVEPLAQWFMQFLQEEMSQVSGQRDLTQLANLGQVPSTETIEKMQEAMSPAIRLRSRYLEAFLREFAMMNASNLMQFYDLPRRISILGNDGVTFEDFDLDPGTLVPDFVNETDFVREGSNELTNDARRKGPSSRAIRAQQFLRYFTFHIAPGSLLNASEISRKLLYLQLARAGYVDIWTLLDVLGVANVGEPPSGAATITDRLAAQQNMGIGMSVNPAGRKASGQTMPRVVTKES